MNNSEVPNVGEHVRMLRENRGHSLRALAQRSHLSINAIRRIELGEASPTVSSLHRIALALGVPIVELFSEGYEHSTVFVRRDDRLHYKAEHMLMESLGGGLRNQEIAPFLMTLDPDASDWSEPVVHPGQEFVLCLEGEIDYTIGTLTYRLEGGDSLLFEAGQPHRFRNAGDLRAVLVVIFQAGEGGHLAQQRHLAVANLPDVDFKE